MPEELSLAIQQICEEKGISLEAVKETIEDALAAAYRKDFGDKKTQNIKVKFELSNGNFEVFDIKEVVEDELKEKYEKLREEIEKLKAEGKEIPETLRQTPAETAAGQAELEEKKFNPRTMIALSDAKQEKKSIKLADELVRQLEVPADFGRMAAQTAKQVIIQKLREAERNTLYEEYKEKVSDLIVGTVQRQEGKIVLVDLGNTTAIMLPPDQVKSDKYQPGARMKFYLKSVEQSSKGPEIIVSRSHPEMLRKLFKLEVPEINTGAVQIKSIARDAGSRSKVAVWAKEENLDPIGACIGQRGSRVQTIINELGGEKIDIIEWDEDIEKFIINGLAPAKVLSVEVDEENKIAKAMVKEDQYSLAIGKGGQNVRLAAQLAGVKIDVVMEKGAEEVKEGEGADEGEKKKEEIEKSEIKKLEIKGKEDKKKDDKKEVKDEKKKKETKKSETKNDGKVEDGKKDKEKKEKSDQGSVISDSSFAKATADRQEDKDDKKEVKDEKNKKV